MIRKLLLRLIFGGMLLTTVVVVGYVLITMLAPPESALLAAEIEVPTASIPAGEHIVVDWHGDPIVFSKDLAGDVKVFIAISTFRGCGLQFDPLTTIANVEQSGAWIDICHVGAWGRDGKFLPGVNSGSVTNLPDLLVPQGIRWNGDVATLSKG